MESKNTPDQMKEIVQNFWWLEHDNVELVGDPTLEVGRYELLRWKITLREKQTSEQSRFTQAFGIRP